MKFNLKAAKEIRAAGTSGDWCVHPHFPDFVIVAADKHKMIGGAVDPEYDRRYYARQVLKIWVPKPGDKIHPHDRTAHEAISDVAFIALAPAMLEEIIRLRAQVARLKKR